MKNIIFNNSEIRDESVDKIHASELTPNVFYREYWCANKPILIKGAIDHWPACSKWGSDGYLVNNIGSAETLAYDKTPVEGGSYQAGVDDFFIPFDEFYKKITDNTDSCLWLHALPLILERSSSAEQKRLNNSSEFTKRISALADKDFLDFKFLHHTKHPIRYSAWRIFIYKNSLTDWHLHPTDSHLMCQIKGTKEVFLLPPIQGFDIIQPIIDRKVRSFDATEAEQHKIKMARPYRVEVEQGDAFHIPIHWYHMVRPIYAESYGVTLAHAFRSPFWLLGDKRLKLNRRLFDAASNAQKIAILYARFASRLRVKDNLFLR